MYLNQDKSGYDLKKCLPALLRGIFSGNISVYSPTSRMWVKSECQGMLQSLTWSQGRGSPAPLGLWKHTVGCNPSTPRVASVTYSFLPFCPASSQRCAESSGAKIYSSFSTLHSRATLMALRIGVLSVLRLLLMELHQRSYSKFVFANVMNNFQLYNLWVDSILIQHCFSG